VSEVKRPYGIDHTKLATHFEMEYRESEELMHAALEDAPLLYLLMFAIRHGIKGAGGLSKVIVALSQARSAELEDRARQLAREPLQLVFECPKCKGQVAK
jgi:hypothetical protein